MLQDFFSFLRAGKTGNKKEIIKDFIILFSLVLLVKYSLLVSKAILFDVPIVDEETLEKLNGEQLISYVLILPIFEEILFRGPLALKKNINYIIPLGATLIFLSVFFLSNTIILLTIISIISILIVLIKTTDLQIWLKRILEKYYLMLVLISSIMFGMMHLFNYEVLDSEAFLPVVGITISGFYLAYMTTKYNLFSSFLLHATNNLLVFFLILYFRYQ